MSIMGYHKGTQRSFVFLIHERDFVGYPKIIDDFLHRWYGAFSEEYTDKGDPAGQVEGGAFVLEKSDGTVITVEKRADGKIQTKSSRNPGLVVIMEMDYFCSQIGY